MTRTAATGPPCRKPGNQRTIVSATINRLMRNGELKPLGQSVRVPSGRRLAALASS